MSDCTNNGFRLFEFLALIIGGLIVAELGILVEIITATETVPKTTMFISLSSILITLAGLDSLLQGLANSEFLMPMRVALVSAGFLLSVGSVFLGIYSCVSSI